MKGNNWARVKFGDVVTLVNGRAYKQHEMLASGTPILRIQNLNGGNKWFFSDINLPPEKYCAEGDLLYAWSATFGPYIYSGPKAIFHYHIWNVLPSPAIERRFVYYELLRITADLKRAAHGVAMPHITKAGMEAWEIGLPSISEQKRVADKLDAVMARVDACRDRLARIGPVLNNFRQSVLAAAVGGRLTMDFREERGQSDDWLSTTIGSITLDLRYGTSKKCDYLVSGVGVLRIPNVAEFGQLDTSDLKYSNFDEGELKKLSIRIGDLLVIRSNGSVDLVGKTGVVGPGEEGLLFAGYLMRLRIDASKVLPRYVWIALSEPTQRHRIVSVSKSTSGVNNINANELRALPLQLPTLSEQSEIVRRVDLLFAFADRLETRLQKAQAAANRLTPALLAKAFRGELVPQDPNDEPAAELLRRLAAQRVGESSAKKRKAKAATPAVQDGEPVHQQTSLLMDAE